jgi:acyl-CoA-dependent ceramide synthase
MNEYESIAGALRRLCMEHQLGLSLNFIILLGMTHVLFPSLRPTTKSFFTLSYPSADSPGLYSQGPKDMYLVATCVVYFTAFRALMLDYVLTPLAGTCGIGRRKGRVRFAEQSYMLIYYTIIWFWGLALFVKDTPADVDSVESLLISMWRDFPRLLLTPGMKLYYLSQLAFWVQQIVVIHLEERRKDHYQMLTHHFVTVGLMVGSYGYRQWRVGNAILVCMDIVDLVLPAAKILRYLGRQAACDAMFGLFVITWFLARHVLYLLICWSIYAHVNVEAMPYGLYSTSTGEMLSKDGGENVLENLLQPMLNPEAKTISFNANIRWSFLGLLLGLQCITLVWLVMIIRVVVRVIRGQGADDTRSDDEDEIEEDEIEDKSHAQLSHHSSVPIVASPEEELEEEKPRFIEVETTSEEVAAWSARNGSNGNAGRKKPRGISSGLKLGEHKEILNRIGCLSEEQLAREKEVRQGSNSPGLRREG